MGAAAFGVFLLFASLLIIRKFHDKVKAKILDILKKTFFNGLIRSHSVMYLNLVVTFSVVIFIER